MILIDFDRGQLLAKTAGEGKHPSLPQFVTVTGSRLTGVSYVCSLKHMPIPVRLFVATKMLAISIGPVMDPVSEHLVLSG